MLVVLRRTASFLKHDSKVTSYKIALLRSINDVVLTYPGLKKAVKAISRTLEMPIRYAGPGEWSIFNKPQRYKLLSSGAVAILGTKESDRCLVVSIELWETFRRMSLWIEALCIREWCLFTERVSSADRSAVYSLLTARPDNGVRLLGNGTKSISC